VTATIRLAEPRDARAIAQVHVDTWRAAYPGIFPQETLDALDVDERERLWGRYIGVEDVAVFVAEQEGPIVGFASAGPASEVEHTGELYALYLHPDAWGTGIGSALLDTAVAWLAERWTEAVLSVAEQNPRARRFYESHGWQALETRVEEIRGVQLATVRYRLSGLDRR
jgi:ribosomal protein S18 acetylase RimI-like enzyme